VGILKYIYKNVEKINNLRTQITQNKNYIQGLIVSTENLTNEISKISTKMVVFKNKVQPLLEISLFYLL
jgi:hypothetical protein